MVQVYSQNGWPAYADTNHFKRINVCGRGWWCANADVAVVFTELISRFDVQVEDVTNQDTELDDWSYANRLVRGSTSSVSNHGAATAIDINSLQHPLGRVNTFTAAQKSTIGRILASICDDDGRPVLRWGGNYTGRKDEMHFEIIANQAKVKQAANRIRKRAEEDSMPTTAEIVAALKPVIAAEVAKAVAAPLTVAEIKAVIEDTLAHSPLVRNQPLPGTVEGPKFSTTGALSNIEKDVDTVVTLAGTIPEIAAAVAEILLSVKANQPAPPPAAG